MPAVEKRFLEDLRKINKGLFVVWNDILERYQILFKDVRMGENSPTKMIYTVEEDDGSFRRLDERTIIWVANNVCWDLIGLYPEPEDLYRHLRNKRLSKEQKAKSLRKEYIDWWNKDHKTQWRAAIENARRGII